MWWLESSTIYSYFEDVKSRGVLDSLCLIFGCLRQQIFQEEVRGVIYFTKCFPRHPNHVGSSVSSCGVLTRKAKGFLTVSLFLPLACVF